MDWGKVFSRHTQERIDAKLDLLLHGQVRILRKEARLMAAIDDLNTAVADVVAAIAQAVDLLKNPPAPQSDGSPDPAVETAAADLEAAAQALKAAFPAAAGDVTGTPA